MMAPVSWLAEYADLPDTLRPRELADALLRIGLEVERVSAGADGLSGPIVVGRVEDLVDEPQKNGKIIRWCQVEVGEPEPRGIVCGAHNFAAGDLVVVTLPGAVLPGDFAISARRTYGHISDGMICSVRELGIGEDHEGILVLAPGSAEPGADALAVLGLRDAVLDIAVTPDRGYCLSIRGLAREAALAVGVEFHEIDTAPPEPDGRAHEVRIDDPTGCDRFSMRVVAGLNPTAPTPEWMARRLRQCGMRSISLAVDVTNYVMLETGQPLHAFDRGKLAGAIVARRARPGESLATLDGVTRALDPDDMVVADDSGPVALAGVMGGWSTEIDGTTTEIALEAAHWDPASVARAVRRHKLPSEASRRFERGVDPEIAGVALQRCVELLVGHGGARSVGGFTVVGGAGGAGGAVRGSITLDSARPGSLAGIDIDDATVVEHLRGVGCGVTVGCGVDGGATVLTVSPPTWRPDLTDPADLIEEVVRLVGYDRLPSRLPTPPAGSGLTASQRVRRSLSRALAAGGYTEVLSYPFVAEDVADRLGLEPADSRREAVRLANPLSEVEPLLRTSLLPGLFATVLRNTGRGAHDLALFETGLVYGATTGASPMPRPGVARRPSAAEVESMLAAIPTQRRHVAAVLCGDVEPAGWWGPARAAGWDDAVEAARLVGGAARVHLLARADRTAPWHPGRCAQILLDETVIGHAGELHPRVVAAFGLPPRSCAMELDIDALTAQPAVRGPQLSTFPPVLLDVALTVPEAVAAADVSEALRAGGGDLLEDVRLFDVYRDERRLGVGLKSLAFALRLRAPDRTLTVEQASAARDAAVARATSLGARLRS